MLPSYKKKTHWTAIGNLLEDNKKYFGIGLTKDDVTKIVNY